jgi:Ca-activated chloride channel family protein
MKYIFFLLAVLFLIVPASSQTQSNELKTFQKNGKTLVKIPVIVSDREGRRIPGIKKEEFSVFKGGKEQPIESFDTEREPVSIALLLDTSGSTQEVLKKIKDGAKDFIDLLNPGDQCLIATFDSKINFLISFTSNPQNLKDSLEKIKTADAEGTLLFNVINQITETSFSRIKGRKAIVVLSDGKDYGSNLTQDDLLSRLNESDVSIYPIYYQSGSGFNKMVIADNGEIVEGKEISAPKKPKKKKKAKKGYAVMIPLPADTYTPTEIKLIDKVETANAVSTLQKMSDLTAGRFYLSDADNLSTIFKKVAGELKQQYSLGIYTDGEVGNDFMRDVRVKVDRPSVVVQTKVKLSVKNQ